MLGPILLMTLLTPLFVSFLNLECMWLAPTFWRTLCVLLCSLFLCLFAVLRDSPSRFKKALSLCGFIKAVIT